MRERGERERQRERERDKDRDREREKRKDRGPSPVHGMRREGESQRDGSGGRTESPFYIRRERITLRSTSGPPKDERRTLCSTFGALKDERRTLRSTFGAAKDERRTLRSTFVVPRALGEQVAPCGASAPWRRLCLVSRHAVGASWGPSGRRGQAGLDLPRERFSWR